MTIEPKFLADVQKAGWLIVAVDEDKVVAGCPRSDCQLKTAFKPQAPIPQVCQPKPALAEEPVSGFDDWRVVLRRRREQLGFTIKDVEAAAGIADDFLAKFEKDNPSKIPNAQTTLEWAQTLGYQVVLRPGYLPPITLAAIADTRAMLRARQKHFAFRARTR